MLYSENLIHFPYCTVTREFQLGGSSFDVMREPFFNLVQGSHTDQKLDLEGQPLKGLLPIVVVMITDRLGPLERTIMEVFWEKKQADARDVYFELNKKKKIAYTTINTTLTRLHKKGLLKRKLVKGRGGHRYIYTIAKSKPMYIDHVIGSTIDDLLMRFGTRTISYFSESLNLSEKDVEKLRARLKELSHE